VVQHVCKHLFSKCLSLVQAYCSAVIMRNQSVTCLITRNQEATRTRVRRIFACFVWFFFISTGDFLSFLCFSVHRIRWLRAWFKCLCKYVGMYVMSVYDTKAECLVWCSLLFRVDTCNTLCNHVCLSLSDSVTNCLVWGILVKAFEISCTTFALVSIVWTAMSNTWTVMSDVGTLHAQAWS
jgi:hypothetical protein